MLAPRVLKMVPSQQGRTHTVLAPRRVMSELATLSVTRNVPYLKMPPKATADA